MKSFKKNIYRTETDPIVDLCCSLPDVTIGTQIWTACNLDVKTYTDGTPIPEIAGGTAWTSATTGGFCYLGGTVGECTYGLIYNWYAIAGIYDAASLANPALRKQLAPVGYHIPTQAEYTTLATTLGGFSIAGGPLKAVGTTYWQPPNTGATNSTGFTALAGAIRDGAGIGQFNSGIGGWWLSNEFDLNNGVISQLFQNSASTTMNVKIKTTGCAVRLIKD